jgi:hypothetical protein
MATVQGADQHHEIVDVTTSTRPRQARQGGAECHRQLTRAAVACLPRSRGNLIRIQELR